MCKYPIPIAAMEGPSMCTNKKINKTSRFQEIPMTWLSMYIFKYILISMNSLMVEHVEAMQPSNKSNSTAWAVWVEANLLVMYILFAPSNCEYSKSQNYGGNFYSNLSQLMQAKTG